MKIIDTKISEIKIIEPEVYKDARGFFFESFNLQKFQKVIGYEASFVQDNHSKSSKGVLRGLHYQLQPYEQCKLFRVVQGKVFDVVVDLRRSSPTFGDWIGCVLSAENKRQIWIPSGFAHGFLTLSDTAEVVYKTSNYYASEWERCIRWDDETIKIDWPIEHPPLLSKKDACADSFCNAEVFE